MLFQSRKWGGPDHTEIVPFAHSLEKHLFPSFFPVQDPADRNRHARHLDVIPTLIARFEGLCLGPGGSWTVQAVISSARNSNDGANHSILAAASLRLATTTRYYDVVLWRSYNT